MSYLGRTELKSSDIRLKAAYAISGTSTNTVVLTWTAPSEESLIFTVNGVVQQTDAFSIAGTPTTITLASGNFADGATVEVVGINDIGTAIIPADGSITSLKLADDAVTLAKMADDSVGVAELATTGTPTGAKFLQDDMAWTTVDSLPSQTSQSGKFLTTDGSAASWGTVAGGLTQSQQWRVSADFSISTSELDVYQNWEKPASAEFPGSIGSDMAVDSTTSATLSGAWTFPETGTWLVRWCFFNEGSGGSASLYARIYVTDDNGANWVAAAGNDSYGFHNQDSAVSLEYVVNVADTSTDKVRFSGATALYSVVIRGNTDYNAHYATFMRLGDAT